MKCIVQWLAAIVFLLAFVCLTEIASHATSLRSAETVSQSVEMKCMEARYELKIQYHPKENSELLYIVSIDGEQILSSDTPSSFSKELSSIDEPLILGPIGCNTHLSGFFVLGRNRETEDIMTLVIETYRKEISVDVYDEDDGITKILTDFSGTKSHAFSQPH